MIVSKKGSALFFEDTQGFSLVELLIAMAVGLIVLGATYAVFIVQNRNFAIQEQMAEAQQTARITMDVMSDEIRMAGYKPTLPPAGAGIVSAGITSLSFTADLNGDGNTAGPNESVIYSFDAANRRITRNTGGGAQPLAENVQSLSFAYFDSNGNTTAILTAIREIRITLTIRTALPDPNFTQNNGFRTYTLTASITPRNLSY